MKCPVLPVPCADQRGLVHAITGVLLRAGINMVSDQEFVDSDSQRFFMRTELEGITDRARGGETEAHKPSRRDRSRKEKLGIIA